MAKSYLLEEVNANGDEDACDGWEIKEVIDEDDCMTVASFWDEDIAREFLSAIRWFQLFKEGLVTPAVTKPHKKKATKKKTEVPEEP
jgi:hypothetical protein